MEKIAVVKENDSNTGVTIPNKKEKLWTYSFFAAAIGNFLFFFAFYLLLPILPFYLTDTFQVSPSIVGLILSSYTITALLVRPFAGFMVDTFPRKKLLIICYVAFMLFFCGYLLAGSLIMFAAVRALHGAAFGSVTVSNSTVAIDIMPSSRRGEGIGYFGISNNLAMATGPTTSLFLYDSMGDCRFIFLLSMLVCIVGLCFVVTIRVPRKECTAEAKQKQEKEPISLDRFFLIKGIPGAIALCLLSFAYGGLSTYLAIYGKQEVGIESGAGIFFIFMAAGLITARLTSGKMLNQGKVITLITWGILFLIVGYILFTFLKLPVVYFGSAYILGLGYGYMCPAFQTFFVNLAPNNQRGTANSTFYTAWDMGLGSGVLLCGSIAEMSNYSTAYAFSILVTVCGFIFFRLFSANHYLRNQLR